MKEINKGVLEMREWINAEMHRKAKKPQLSHYTEFNRMQLHSIQVKTNIKEESVSKK